MAKKIRVDFNIENGYSQTDYKYSLYTGATSGGTFTLVASQLSSTYSLTVDPSYVSNVIYVKLTCPACKDQIYPVKVIPDPISIEGFPIFVTCPDNSNTDDCENNGRIDIYVCGGSAPYTYSWAASTDSRGFTGSVPPSQVNNKNLVQLTGGDYTVTVTDCYGLTATKTINMYEPNALSLTAPTVVNNTAATNGNGSVTLSVSGGSPTYLYKKGVTGTYQSSATFTGLTPGEYTFVIKDLANCEKSMDIVIKDCYFNAVVCGLYGYGYGYGTEGDPGFIF